MKAIKIHNSEKVLLCDDEDYPALVPHKWYLARCGARRRWQVRTWSYAIHRGVTPLYFLFPDVSVEHFAYRFRDGNPCNYQRYNLCWLKPEFQLGSPKEIPAPHCHLGPAILRPKKTDGRSLACFICSQADYDSYYICLDLVSHKTYWKGWIRHES